MPAKTMVPTHEGLHWTEIAKMRVLHADTDAMGVVYHAAYLRWMEHGRVELVRNNGVRYADLEDAGLGLPVTELAVRYAMPARYDDIVTIRAAVAGWTGVRVNFAYRLTVEPGDRPGLTEPVLVLEGETRHACIRLADGRPTRLPPPVVEVLRNCYSPSA